ncbi:helix-turn-helix transcriptional regulator [Streptomyces bohaiensis]|uniref:LuxR family transcriptional regulator n=1 Tax=Streptomyces bohaiensis TaxID=1431344 RepID=A0ABX1C6E7_9ACTN|nr:LuxR C-terminal-related transcriptional regulator [Streptomyces bohaiensis]NJQ14761.1 LuxR family transcriptional regulator [Streptomyces bohaiensis]
MIHGRHPQLAALVGQATAARSGEVRCVVLAAPPGHGKSRLLNALLAHDVCAGMRVCRLPSGGSVALPEATGLRSRPLVLALDDAHECDEPSLRRITLLLRPAAPRPLLIVLCRRSGAPPRAPRGWADLLAQPSATVLPLPPLDADAVRGLAEETFGGPAHPRFAAAVTDAVSGHPGTAVRLLRALRAAGLDADEAGARQAAEIGGELTARAALRLLEREPDDARRVATALAVLTEARTHAGADAVVGTEARAGIETDVDTEDGAGTRVVAALADVDTARVGDVARFLRHAGAAAPDGGCALHPAVRTALLARLGPRRGPLHARAALLLSDHGRPAEEVARHLAHAPAAEGRWATAVLRRAAAEAERRGGRADAARYLHRVLETEPDDTAARVRLALVTSLDTPFGAIPHFRAALAEAREPALRAAIAVQYAMACISVALPEACRSEAVEALEAGWSALRSGPGADPRLGDQVRAVLLLMGSPVRDAAADPPRPTGATVAATTHPHGADRIQTAALSALHTALAGRSRQGALADARQVQAGPGRRQPPWLHFTLAATFALADETERAHQALDAMLHQGGDRPSPWLRAFAAAMRSLVLQRGGAVLAAAGEARASLADARTAADALARGHGGDEGTAGTRRMLAQAVLAAVHVDRGEPRRAWRVLNEEGRTEPDDCALTALLCLHTRARAYWAAGHPVPALALLRQCGLAQDGAGALNPVIVPWWTDACLVLAELGRPAEGRPLAEQGAERARLWDTPRARGLAALAQGALTPGSVGLDLLAESVHHLADSPAVTEHARAQHRFGVALLVHGDEAGARDRLRRAAGLAVECGALALAERSRRALATAGGRPGRGTGRPPVGLLTSSELRVAGLAISGAGNRDIARQLFVTVRTVESHLTNVYRKLGVHRRDQLGAALRAVRGGKGLPGERADAWGDRRDGLPATPRRARPSAQPHLGGTR